MADRRVSVAIRSRMLRGWLAVLAIGMAVHFLPWTAAIDLELLDGGFAMLRQIAPKPAAAPIAIIGIDEATLEAFPEPIALWHRYVGDILRGLALAQPRAVGIDIELPERSYDFVRPDSDRHLVDGMLAMRAAAPLVIALGIAQSGAVKPLYAPFVAAAGEDGVGLPAYLLDPDRRVRRFDERLGAAGASVPTFAGTLARRLNVQPQSGWIDFSLGPRFDYIPAHVVHQWVREGRSQALAQAFSGHVVLLGSVLPFVDRHALPIALATWEPGSAAPGVLLHAQTLRSLVGPGLVRGAHPLVPLSLVLAGSFLWFALARLGIGIGVLTAFIAAAMLGALWLLHVGIFVPIAGGLATAGIAAAGRAGHDAWFHRRERERLKRSFAGYVSPNVLDLILAGELDTDVGSGVRELCVLFADIRNFTAMSEHRTPEAVVELLNRYFDRMTQAIHGCDGTVDNFRGDGIMCFFGAPQPARNPCRQGFLACRRMLEALRDLNRELERDDIPPLQIGISLAYGKAVVGRVGAAERHEYTAIGDVANVSARLESMTKELGYPVLLTAEVVALSAGAGVFDDLGTREIRGHAPVHVYGWPARAADTAQTPIEMPRAHHG
jgi:class 3 adenylate cyclase/CHASE2 domain-containing sensor protein